MNDLGISRSQLDEIELRLVGVDHRPWAYDPEWRIVMKASAKARKKAMISALREPDGSPRIPSKFADGPVAGERKESEPVFSKREILDQVTLFQQHGNATNDMAKFVAQAPDDIEALVNAVKFLQIQLEKARAEREEFKKEMLASRIEASKLQERLTGIVNAWRNLKQVMG